ncbi:hypothetical protein M758_6G071000 [Ceratodon purpureus]|uniref:Secreted protein n=1 Tax=Ceratodon purpureus TaxID=3225 RepID=A0A8T0HCL7_CERPU|nr:hypothetical protein KC19_6G075700 [Ceratodon purpureus]KAG0613031.1 hypothetical protein M758_6G071000 [Ceratodon purpureus]
MTRKHERRCLLLLISNLTTTVEQFGAQENGNRGSFREDQNQLLCMNSSSTRRRYTSSNFTMPKMITNTSSSVDTETKTPASLTC